MMGQVTTEADARLLAHFLADAARIQSELCGMLESMEKPIIKQDLSLLEERLIAAEPVIRKLESLDSNRSKVFGHLERVTSKSFARDGIAGVIETMPAPERDALHGAADHVRSVAKDVRRRANRCGMLARQAMTFNQTLVRALFSIGDVGLVYDAEGKIRTGGEKILDRSL